ncbi:MAG TPA: DNA topoisomerase I [Caulifigura sp.]|nr:DNA topoisomerase I [Caulifigura sp.]
MSGFTRQLLGPIVEPVVRPIMKPITRLLVGLIAIPLFRIFRRKVVRVQDLNAELEKDVDQWFRASILLLLATKNFESYMPWAENEIRFKGETIEITWFTLGLRLMLAIGVVESMPDQMLFSLIHPGLRRVKLDRSRGLMRGIWNQWKNILLGVICQHLNRSSPVFAILSTIWNGTLGWTFYSLAVAQYLVIGLVTSRDKAIDVLNQFDRRIAEQREDLIEELQLTHNNPDYAPGIDQPHDDTPLPLSPPTGERGASAP